MKNILFFLMGMQLLFAQSGQVEYKVKYTGDKHLSSNTFISKMYKGVKEQADRLAFNLDFNENGSHFTAKNVLAPNKEDKAGSMGFAFANKSLKTKEVDFYVDAKKKQNLEHKEGMLIAWDTKDNEWKLTKEKKKIGKYICFKAIGKTKALKGGKVSKTVAWYTPQITVPYGPKRYNGLPGLVLEAHQRDFIFYASSINLSKKIKDYKLPKSVVNVSWEKYLEVEYNSEEAKRRRAYKKSERK